MMPLGTSQVIAVKRHMKLKRDQLTFPATLSSRDTTKYSMLLTFGPGSGNAYDCLFFSTGLDPSVNLYRITT